MSAARILTIGLVMAAIATPGLLQAQTPMGTAFTYQGQLKQGGNPLTGTADLKFTLWADPNSADPNYVVGATITLGNHNVTSGLFTVKLDFGADVFTGDARWLGISVRSPHDPNDAQPYTTLSPRQKLTPAPYALALPGLWTQQNVTCPNLIGGFSGNSATAGVVGATVGGGGEAGLTNRVTDHHGTVGGGLNNLAGDDVGAPDEAKYATVGGGTGNRASNWCATIGGGIDNEASHQAATVGGGEQNQASGEKAVVAGGGGNTATEVIATVAGGGGNDATADGATIGGGADNEASALKATVGGGANNIASGEYAVVAGGVGNIASADVSTVAGGGGNLANVDGATVGGGADNIASGVKATVAGGSYNHATADYATIAGGGPTNLGFPNDTNNHVYDNYGTIGGGGNNEVGSDDADPATDTFATIGGGQSNTANEGWATIGGGQNNAAGPHAAVGGGWSNYAKGPYGSIAGGYDNTVGGGNEEYAAVGGGNTNWANGRAATIPGGEQNEVWADYSFAAGRRAKVNHTGTFTWADSIDADFSSTGNNQFLIRAGGGVGVNTNNPAGYGMNVNGSVNATDLLINGVSVGGGTGGIGGGGTTNYLAKFTGATVIGDSVIYEDAVGDIGIGTTLPATKLDVAGTVRMTGIELPTGAQADYVLTSDSSGTGTWQPASGGNGWSLTGNQGTDPNSNYLGTTDHVALQLRVDGIPVLRLKPTLSIPNVIAGYAVNSVTDGVVGATISGGGQAAGQNRVMDDYGTVGGGANNRAGDDTLADADYATVGGGENNWAADDHATVAGGEQNTASQIWSTVGGGTENTASHIASTVSGGVQNIASGERSAIGGGVGNRAVVGWTTIAGGKSNWAGDPNNPSVNDEYATVGGGLSNKAFGGTIAGGYRNTAHGGAIGGGSDNEANADATVAGGYLNKALGNWSTVGGGQGCEAKASNATVGGGENNHAIGECATIAGGIHNWAGDPNDPNDTNPSDPNDGQYASVGGGYDNTAHGEYSTVPGGLWNVAKGKYSFAAGIQNTAKGTCGFALGAGNKAEGDWSFAAGRGARALHEGAFVWADSYDATYFDSQRADQFRVWASGGAAFNVNDAGWINIWVTGGDLITTSTGAHLTTGGAWTDSSDRNAKENFAPVDRQALLHVLADLPITSWNYRVEDSAVRHLGPVAQDFHAAFGLGRDDTHIASLDTAGVALAAIQGLYEIVQDQDAEIAAQSEQLAAQQEEITDLRDRLTRIESRLAELAGAQTGGAK